MLQGTAPIDYQLNTITSVEPQEVKCLLYPRLDTGHVTIQLGITDINY
jgi:hypothetical protein